MWSYPNLVPLPDAEVQRMAAAVEPFAYEALYGAWWGTVIAAGARDDRPALGRAAITGRRRRGSAVEGSAPRADTV